MSWPALGGAVLVLFVPLVGRAEVEPRVALALDADEPAAVDGEPPDKKAAWLADKAGRAGPPPPRTPAPVAVQPVSLRNMWTDEVLPISPDRSDVSLQADFDRFVRCHYTQVETGMSRALLPLLRRAAARFQKTTIEIVSGFRAPKYQLMLRKKGHEVARDSAHPRGQAIDFRLPEVPTRTLLAFVRKQRLGGVGFYPDSKFVHADTGPIRFWRGH